MRRKDIVEEQNAEGQKAEVGARLAQYAKILETYPAYTAAINQVKSARRLNTAASLYLYVYTPVLTEFISWVLYEASAAGKKRLYFLSRDGYQMYLIALRLAKLRQIEIECRYLHVSRYSMRLPQYHLDPDRGIDRICTGGIDVTPERILQRAALSPEEIEEVLQGAGWLDKRQEILDYRRIQKLKEILRSSLKLREYLKKHSLEEYENAIGYLEQEGLLSDIPFAIVDSGWVGTLQESMQILMQSKCPQLKIEGYYFGLYELPPGADAKSYHAWYFSPGKGLRRKAGFSNSLFETICSSDEGMTLYYRASEGRFLPMQDERGNPNSRQLRENLKILHDFLEQLQSLPAWIPDHFGQQSGLPEKLFSLFMACPCAAEVFAYGDSLFSDDMLEGNRKKAAAELTGQEIRIQRLLGRLLIAAGIRKAVIRESAWIEGSIVRCGKHVKCSLVHARLYKYAVFGRKQLKYIWHVKSGRNRKLTKCALSARDGAERQRK